MCAGDCCEQTFCIGGRHYTKHTGSRSSFRARPFIRNRICQKRQRNYFRRGSVLLKGGHAVEDANDLLYDGENEHWYRGRRVNNPNTHNRMHSVFGDCLRSGGRQKFVRKCGSGETLHYRSFGRWIGEREAVP